MTSSKISLILENNQNADGWGDLFIKILPAYQINSPLRILHFLTQICYESSYCNKLEENLNYSSTALLKIYPQHFSNQTANLYGRNQNHLADKIMIGNILYANRLGNGDIASGDGYKFRGRGLIQLTGKENYQNFSRDVFKNDDIAINPDLLLSNKETAIHSACWFWGMHNLNYFADQNDIKTITKKINGGLSSLNDRLQILAKIQTKLAITI